MNLPAIPQSHHGLFQPITDSVQDEIKGMFLEHDTLLSQIKEVADTMADKTTVSYFVRGNVKGESAHHFAETLFNREGAIAALSATFWDRVLKLTDVLDCMPQKRRDEWFDAINKMKTPPFTPAGVSTTLIDLLSSREKFFAERVDGVFQRLSPTHVTNSPMGFRKRMILNYVVDPKFGMVEWSRAGTINDLRVVIARFMGRDEPYYSSTSEIIRYLYEEQRGKWMDLDGGTLRMRVYKKGTVHLEIHEEMAWKLNQLLAMLHPQAIPEEHRKRPSNKRKSHTLFDKLIPFKVLSVISKLLDQNRGEQKTFRRTYDTSPTKVGRHVWEETQTVMEALGAVYSSGCFTFEYPARETLKNILLTGAIPDQKSPQFYPTPASIVEKVIHLAEVEPHHKVLEPSAGCGNMIASLDPKQVTCVEVNRLHCGVLQARGLTNIQNEDFLEASFTELFDRIVMNPPFSEGRWKDHLEHAARLLQEDGVLVAVLPASARNKDLLPGWDVTFSEPEPFPGTSISVTILRGQHQT